MSSIKDTNFDENQDQSGGIEESANTLGLDPEALQEAFAAMAAAKRKEEEALESVFTDLASDINGKLTARLGARRIKENQWLESYRLGLGSLASYDANVTIDNPFGTPLDGSRSDSTRPEYNIVRPKCEIAVAQTIQSQFAGGDKNWQLLPPPVTDVDQDDMQYYQQLAGQGITAGEIAEWKTSLMEAEIESHLEQTGYALEIRKAMDNRVYLGTGIMKGPQSVGKLKMSYKKDRTSDGKIIRVPQYTVESLPTCYSVFPWYWLPDERATCVSDIEDCIELHPMTATALRDLIKHPGFIKEQIAKVLEEEPKTFTQSLFTDPSFLTGGTNTMKGKYLVAEYHGPIKKSDLKAVGKMPVVESPLDYYFGEIWVVNQTVIRIQLSNLEGCYRIPYAACVWERDPASVFGFGVPMLVRDQQRVVNETYKMMLDNAGISSGPQFIIDTTLIKPLDGGMEITPWKGWEINEYGADASKAIQFFVPPNSFEGLAALQAAARGFADEESSIPLIQAGIQGPAEGQSATGMAIMNQNATAPLFYKSEKWDDEITRPLMLMILDWEMQYNPKEEIKANYQLDVRTSTQYLRGLLEQSKMEKLLQMAQMKDSPLQEWIDLGELSSAYLNSMKLPSKNIVKSPEEVAKARQERAQQPPQPDPNMLKAQTDAQRLELEKQKFQFEAQSKQAETQLKQQTEFAKMQLQERTAMLDHSNKMHQTQMGTQVQQMKTQAQIDTMLLSEQSKKHEAGMDHVKHAMDIQVDLAKIASAEKIAKYKEEEKLRQIRVNAKERTKSTANRKLDKRNPKK